MGKTEAADQRYWLERGQTPQKCPLREEGSPAQESASESKPDDEPKSRYCRKRWYC